MYSLWVFLVALGVATRVPNHIRATSLDPFLFQQLPVSEKADAICNAIGLLSIKAALLAATSDNEVAFQNGAHKGEAQITYREAPSTLEGDFLKAIDCHLGLESPHVCATEVHAKSSGEEAPAEATSTTPTPEVAPTAAAVETRPLPRDRNGDTLGSGGGSLDLNASWTISALQRSGENLLSDPDILTHLGKRAVEVARDFFKVAAGGRLLEPSSNVFAGEFDEENLGEVVRLAGKFLGSLQLNLSPHTLEIKTETHHGTSRRLTSKEIGAFLNAHKDCSAKGDIFKVSDLESKVKGVTELKGKLYSDLKGKCGADLRGKCDLKGKKKCGKHCAPASEHSPNVEPALITASAMLPLSSPYQTMVQPPVVPLPSNLPAGTQVIYGLNNVATAAANAAGTAAAPVYHDGVWLFPIPQPTEVGAYQFIDSEMNQFIYPYPFNTNGVDGGVYLLGSNGPASTWRSIEFLPRVTMPIRNSILQDISPLFLSPIAAVSAQLHQSSLLSPLYRSALGKFFLDHKDAVHYEELRNFNMTMADLF